MASHQEKEERKALREQEAEKAKENKDAKKKVKNMLILSTGFAIVVILGFIIVNTTPVEPERPSLADHWHADYTIELCGETQPPLPQFPGGFHTHGDGQLHIHPHESSETGSNANLRLFFSRAGVPITEESVEVDSKTYSNGDLCDGEEASLSILANEQDVDLSYVPQDGDVIRIVFG
jgi:hypothetical protein